MFIYANSGQKGKNDNEKAKKVDLIGIEITDFQTPDKILSNVSRAFLKSI